jgi:long-chain acyl-CoA synthetase
MPDHQRNRNARSSRFLNRIRFIADHRLTIGNLIHKVIAAHGNMPLFSLDVELGYGDMKGVITGHDLFRFLNQFRNILVSEFDLQRYQRVAILKCNSPEYFFCGYGVMYGGGIAVPINGGMSTENVVRYLNCTGSRLLITDVANYRRLEASLTQVNCLDGVIIADNVPLDRPPRLAAVKVEEMFNLFARVPVQFFHPVDINGDDICLICHTSGTTGFPKGVVHTNASLVAGLRRQLVAEPVTSKDRALSASPFNHFINYTGLLSAMLANIQTWLVTQDSPEEILGLIDRVGITVVFCFPHTYQSIYARGLQGYRLDSVRLWLAGADSSHEAHIAPFLKKGAFLRVWGRPVVGSIYADTYGSSEMGFAALFRFASRYSRLFGRHIGKPNMVGPRIKVVDEQGREMLAGKPGRLVVKGPTLFKGYWNDMQKTQETVQNGWLWPGDIGYCDLQGRFFHLDRAADVIRKNGHDIYSLPIEEVILKFAEVVEAVVIGKDARESRGHRLSEENMQGRIAAVIQFNDRCRAETQRRAIADAINASLGPNEQIDEFYSVDGEHIPRGLTGKVPKRIVRERLQNGEYDACRQFMKTPLVLGQTSRFCDTGSYVRSERPVA